MRYAIVSDIHANLQAWNNILLDIRSSRVDRIICLGDIVGYGPDPTPVLQSIHREVDHLVLGNHDAAICGKMDAALFNDDAQKLIEWTRRRLGANAVRFLAGLPLTVKGNGFRCAHGEFSAPGRFDYVIEPEDAMGSWKCVPEPLLFVGHTHCRSIHVIGQSGTPHVIEAQDFVVEPGKRYLVNVGSAGQPRDGDVRGSYVVYDEEQQAVLWQRTPFDLDAYRVALKREGLPEAPSYFLRVDPRGSRPPLRELLDFAPSHDHRNELRDNAPVQLLAARRSSRRWKAAALGISAGLILAAAAMATTWWIRASRRLVLSPSAGSPIVAQAVPAGANMIQPPAAGRHPWPQWRIEIPDQTRQSVAIGSADGAEHTLQLRPVAATPIRLTSLPIDVQPGMKLTLAAMCRGDGSRHNLPLFSISVIRVIDGAPQWTRNFLRKEPNMPRRDGWWALQTTLTVPPDVQQLQIEIETRGSGTCAMRHVELYRRE